MNFNAVLSPARFAPCTPAAGGFRRRVRRSRTVFLLRSSLLLPLALVVGCGGGANSAANSTRQTGRLQVVVNWPAYQPSVGVGSSAASKQAGASGGRLIPLNATRIDITVQDSQGGQQKFSVTRQNPAHTFVLPTGDATVSVREYDGDSPVTPQAQLKQTIVADKDTLFPITPQTNIDHIQVVANSQRLVVGGSGGSVTAVAYSDAAGTSVVPVADGDITFNATDSGTATVSGAVSVTMSHNTAAITSVHAGDVDVTANLKFQGGSSSDPTFSSKVTLHIVPGITLSPTSATAPVSSPPNPPTQPHFTAQLQGDVGGNAGGVTWSVVDVNGNLYPNNAGGTAVGGSNSIPPLGRYEGIYTPPNVRGTYYVRATSRFDSSQHADATVQVLGGNASINVN